MNELSAKAVFLEKDFAPKNKQYLHELSTVCVRDRSEILTEIAASLKETCKAVAAPLGTFPIQYVTYTFLRTNLLQQNFNYEIMAYDEHWYYGEEPLELGVYHAGWAFHFIKKLWNESLEESKKYVGKVKPYDVENLILGVSAMYAEHVNILFHDGVKLCKASEEWALLQQGESCRISIGEYIGKQHLLATVGK